MDLVWRGALGGVVVAAVLLLNRINSPFAAVVLFFPSLALPTFYFVGTDQGAAPMRQLLLRSVLALPVWLVWVSAVYLLSFYVSPALSLVLSLIVWAVAALAFSQVSPWLWARLGI